MLKNFLIFLSSFNVIPKKNKKTGHCSDGCIFFSDFTLISEKKKKVLRLSSIQERGAVGFWWETKMPEKFRTFLRLKGTLNTSTFLKMVTGTAVLF